MPSDRYRILELALESLENKKKQIDEEIAEISRELRAIGAKIKSGVQAKSSKLSSIATRKRPRFSKEERMRRSQRMKAYWENWRKKKAREKKSSE